MLNILLIEDDIELAATLIDYLKLHSIYCDHAANGIASLSLVRDNNNYQVIVLDINLPRMDGLSVCEIIRSYGIDTPVLMLTGKGSIEAKIAGFESGADDYLVKPFDFEELTARLRALAKRRSGQVSIFKIGNLTVDLKQKKAWRDQKILKLSPITFQLLKVLALNSPNPVGRDELIQTIWGDSPPASNSLKVHIHHLRKQIDGNSANPLFQTDSRLGFALRE
ncbi:MAG: response regulator transcription factor [Cellvibrionaceae bacterium]|nr:response regulator transcription factor [Cellvibrionaceae bacterium]